MNRQEKLESRKFALLFGESLRDELTDEQTAVLAYYIANRDDCAAGMYLRDIVTPIIESTIRFMEEMETPEPSEQDDCGSYKESRDMNPGMYK